MKPYLTLSLALIGLLSAPLCSLSAPTISQPFSAPILESLTNKGWKATTTVLPNGNKLMLRNEDGVTLSIAVTVPGKTGSLEVDPNERFYEADTRKSKEWMVHLFEVAPKGVREVRIVAVDADVSPTRRIEVALVLSKKSKPGTIVATLKGATVDIMRIFRHCGWRDGDAYSLENGMIKVGSGWGIVIDPTAMK